MLEFSRCLVAACEIGQRRTVDDAGDGNDGLDPSCIRAALPKIPGHQLGQLQAGLRARAMANQDDRIVSRPVGNEAHRVIARCLVMPCFLAMLLSIMNLRSLDLREELARPVVERTDWSTLGPMCIENTFELRQGVAPVKQAPSSPGPQPNNPGTKTMFFDFMENLRNQQSQAVAQ